MINPIDKQVNLDLKFQESLQGYDKRALAQLLSHIGQNESTRQWMLESLDAIQALGEELGVFPTKKAPPACGAPENQSRYNRN